MRAHHTQDKRVIAHLKRDTQRVAGSSLPNPVGTLNTFYAQTWIARIVGE